MPSHFGQWLRAPSYLCDADANSNRTSITHPDGVVTYYDHDGLDRVTLIREWDNDPLASFGYDAMGRRAHIVRGNGAVTFYAYDGASRLSEMMQDLPGTASDIWTPFGYNPASQISSTSRSNDAYVWMGTARAAPPLPSTASTSSSRSAASPSRTMPTAT